MLGERCDHPNDHESDHTYPDTHSLADSGSNPCSLGSSNRGCRERSRGADTMIQTTMLGARFHVPYTSACPNAGWEARLGERSSLHCQAVLPLCLSHYIFMVMGLLQTRSDTLFFFFYYWINYLDQIPYCFASHIASSTKVETFYTKNCTLWKRHRPHLQ